MAVANPSTPPLNLIIRFASSIPDLLLPIPSPSTTNASTIRTLIRPHLPPNVSTSPLRLIYAGALLPADKPLSTTLRLPPQHAPNGTSTSPSPPPPPQLYIHCSLATDTSLTATELDAESRAGALHSTPAATAPPLQSQAPDPRDESDDQDEDDDNDDPTTWRTADGPADGSSSDRRRQNQQQRTTTTTTARHRPHPRRTHPPAVHETPTSTSPPPPPPPPPPPQGFDRLLAAGLTPPEVASLRSRFLAIQAHTHTPDTMPTASELRALEERWLDNGGGGVGDGGGGGGGEGDGAGAAPGGFADDTEAGGLEDMLWGNVMGFFWAVGAVVWLVREDGVWSKRRQIGVVTGVLVNLAFCFLRIGG